jgi:hypothetical protein
MGLELASSGSVLQPSDWAIEPNLLGNLTFPDQFRGYNSYIPGHSFHTFSVVSEVHPADTGSFSLRTPAGRGQILVPLLLRILQSYPFMLLRKETFPPFVSPLLYSWAETGKAHPQQVSIGQNSPQFLLSNTNLPE